MKKKRIDFITKVGVFSAIAFVLQIMGNLLPKVGGFLEIEFSDLPALIMSLALGPWAGVAVEFIKNLLHAITMNSTGFVGDFANFVINGIFVFVCGSIYQKNRTKKGAVIALSVSTIALVISAFFVNLFVMLPLYMGNLPFETRLNTDLFTIAPFNFVRGCVLSVITIFIYKKISRFLK